MYALRIAQKGLLALQIVYFLFSMPVVYRPHPLHRQVLMRLRMLKLSVGKGRQVIKQLRVLQYYATVATERAGYVLFRALVTARFNIALSACHLPGSENAMANALSCTKLSHFFSQANRYPYPIPAVVINLLTKPHLNWTSHAWRETFSTIFMPPS